MKKIPPFVFFLIAALVQITWGLTPTASKLVIAEIPVELFIAVRWTIAGLIFSTYVWWTRSWRKISLRDFAMISALGFFGYGLASFGTLYGLKIGGVTNFALMSAVSPIISSLLSIILLNERPRKSFLVALPLSVFGLALLVVGKYQISNIEIAGLSVALILSAYFCESLVFIFSKRYKEKVSLTQYLAIAQLSTGAIMWLAQFAHFNQIATFQQLDFHGSLAVMFVSIVSCVLCFGTMYWLLRTIDGHRLALFDGLHVLSAVFFGFLIFHEPIHPLTIAGGGLILLGLLVGNFPMKTKSPDPE